MVALVDAAPSSSRRKHRLLFSQQEQSQQVSTTAASLQVSVWRLEGSQTLAVGSFAPSPPGWQRLCWGSWLTLHREGGGGLASAWRPCRGRQQPLSPSLPQRFAKEAPGLFSSECKRMSAEIFGQTMPLGKHWRLTLQTGTLAGAGREGGRPRQAGRGPCLLPEGQLCRLPPQMCLPPPASTRLPRPRLSWARSCRASGCCPARPRSQHSARPPWPSWKPGWPTSWLRRSNSGTASLLSSRLGGGGGAPSASMVVNGLTLLPPPLQPAGGPSAEAGPRAGQGAAAVRGVRPLAGEPAAGAVPPRLPADGQRHHLPAAAAHQGLPAMPALGSPLPVL